MSANEEKPFFCYICGRAVTITVSSSSYPLCPICNLGFLQEHDNSNFNPNFNEYQNQNPLDSIPHIVGDYLIGPGLDEVVEMLSENDPNPYGTPPASKSAIQKLLSVTLREQDFMMNNSEMNMKQCAVCSEEYETGMEVKYMPCEHMFHDHCLLAWLQLHNSCPVCRFELPTHDDDSVIPIHDLSKSGSGSGSGSGSLFRYDGVRSVFLLFFGLGILLPLICFLSFSFAF